MPRGNPERVAEICARFQAGDSAAVLASRYGVLRPAIYKTLRAGGVLPAYESDTFGRAAAKKRMQTDGPRICPPRIQPRDPCGFCGVRADIGCRHLGAGA